MDQTNTQTSFLITKDTDEKNSESQLDKKMIERQELFTNENKISAIKEQAISSDLSLGNNEREKLFKSKRLKKTINLDSMSSLTNSLTIPKEFYDYCNNIEIEKIQFNDIVQKIKTESNLNAQYEALVSLRKLLSLQNPPIQEIIDFGLVSVLISFLEHPCSEFKYEALWCLTNISCGTSDQTNSIAIKGGIVKIIQLLDSTIEELLQQTIWTLGNLGGDSDRIRQQIIEHKGYDKIISILQTTNRIQLVKTAVFFISQIAKIKPTLPFDLLKRSIPLVIKNLFVLQDDIEYLVDAFYILSHVTEIYKKCIDSVIDTGILPFVFQSLE